jgi:hypothetical protein
VSRRRSTFGKLQRDRDKQAKAKAKLERRAERSEQGDDDAADDDGGAHGAEVDQAAVLAQLADLHAAFDDGRIGFDDFEIRRAELTSKLRVD